MIYENDESGIRDAREAVSDAELEIAIAEKEKEIAQKEKEIDLIEKEIELFEKQKDAINEQIDALEKQTQSIEKYYDTLIEQQEKFYDSMIESLEKQKSAWEELAEVKEVADAYSVIEQVFRDLGYTVDDVLNNSSGVFEGFKTKYLSILSEMNQNTSFKDGLERASVDLKEGIGSIVNTAQDELSKMNQLGSDAGQGFVEGWNEKAEEIKNATKQTAEEAVDAFAEGQHSNSPSEDYKSKAYDAVDGLILGVNEKKQEFVDTIKSMAEEGVLAFDEAFDFENGNLVNSFDSLKLLIKSVCEAVGLGTEDSVGGLLGALTSLSNISLGSSEEGATDGIIGQFNALKTAVDAVTSSITGGGESNSEAMNGATANKKESSNGEGQSGLTGAITEIGTTTNETLGTTDSESGESEEGEGVLGKFAKFKTAVDEVTKAIGTDEETDDKEANLISALRKHYEVAGETIPEVKSFFEELLMSISACVAKLGELSQGISSLGNGGIPLNGYASGTTYAKKGLAIVGEEKPELIEDTKGNLSLAAKPTLLNMKGGEKVYNAEKTAELLKDDPIYAMHLKAKKYLEENPALLFPTQNAWSRQMEERVNSMKTIPVTNNNRTQTIEQHNQFNVTLPNVNDSTKATQLLSELKRLPLDAQQYASITR